MIRGLERGCEQAAAAQPRRGPDVDRRARLEAAVAPKTVELGRLLERERDGLDQQGADMQPFAHGMLRVPGLNEPHGACHLDRRAHVVVRNLALRAAHRLRDHDAHVSRPRSSRGRGRRRRLRGESALPARAAARSTSPIVIARPARAGPMLARSIPSSAARLRAAGDTSQTLGRALAQRWRGRDDRRRGRGRAHGARRRSGWASRRRGGGRSGRAGTAAAARAAASASIR